MEQVYLAADPLDAHLVKVLLESYGIEVIVRGETLFALGGGLPMTIDILPTVWVVDDDVVVRVRERISAYRRVGSAAVTAVTGGDARDVESSSNLSSRTAGSAARRVPPVIDASPLKSALVRTKRSLFLAREQYDRNGCDQQTKLSVCGARKNRKD